jgi:hypothetical protein
MPSLLLKKKATNAVKTASDAINNIKKNGMTTAEVKALAESRKAETSIPTNEINDTNIREVVFTPKSSSEGNYANVRGTSTNYGTYTDDLNRLTKAQRQAQVDQLKAARRKALANLDAQEQTIKPYYQNARNLTSASSQQGARNFAEYLANRGLTNSGAAAQSEINRLSTLQNNLGNLNTAEANAYRDIANQRTAVENDYVAGLANANNAITNNYYNNLLNYNEQQRQMVQALQNQALGQYANDYQAEINNLLAQGYSPNSLEVLRLQALRGNKSNNLYQAGQSNALANIQAGNINYNNAAALGMTVPQAQTYYNNYVAQQQATAQAEQEALQRQIAQQELENQINLQKLANDTAQTQYNVNKPYNTTIRHISSSGGNKTTPTTVNTKMIDSYLSDIKQDKNLTSEQRKQAQREYLDGLYALNDDSVIDDKTYKDYYAYYGLMN